MSVGSYFCVHSHSRYITACLFYGINLKSQQVFFLYFHQDLSKHTLSLYINKNDGNQTRLSHLYTSVEMTYSQITWLLSLNPFCLQSQCWPVLKVDSKLHKNTRNIEPEIEFTETG